MFRTFSSQYKQSHKGQALVEVAILGAVLIFLLGVVIRNHLSTTAMQNHQVRAMKLALMQSMKSSEETPTHPPNSSRNSSTVLFLEDRLSSDFNKYNNIDRTPFIVSASAVMGNRLFYTLDFSIYKKDEPFGEVGENLPMFDIYINGQHFPLSTAAYVFKVLYTPNDACPSDCLPGEPDPNGPAVCPSHYRPGPEYIRCSRQKAEWVNNTPTFYSIAVNGTQQFDPASGSFDFLRNDWDNFHITTSKDKCFDDAPACPGTDKCFTTGNKDICPYMTWQWRPLDFEKFVFDTSTKEQETHNYPSGDYTGSLKEQTLYAVSELPHDELLTILNSASAAPYILNWNQAAANAKTLHTLVLSKDLVKNNLSLGDSLKLTREPTKPWTGVVIVDNQLGDIDNTYDPEAPSGPKPGLQEKMEIYTQVNPGTYLLIKEGKVYNPETNAVVRSTNSKDHVDLISRTLQLSNNTGRFCKMDSPGVYAPAVNLSDQNNEPNPVKACANVPGECMSNSAYFSKTCLDPFSRVLYVRTIVGDRTTRKWFTDVTKGL